ncbi:MAG: hypothetical protein ABH952_05635 [Candidatus Omnitrophota bacterium]
MKGKDVDVMFKYKNEIIGLLFCLFFGISLIYLQENVDITDNKLLSWVILYFTAIIGWGAEYFNFSSKIYTVFFLVYLSAIGLFYGRAIRLKFNKKYLFAFTAILILIHACAIFYTIRFIPKMGKAIKNIVFLKDMGAVQLDNK